MAVKLRLTRVGKSKQPQYRIVAADTRSPRDGRFIEILGHYDPRPDPSKVVVNLDKVNRWLAEGAQPSERVAKLLEVARNAPAEVDAAEATGAGQTAASTTPATEG